MKKVILLLAVLLFVCSCVTTSTNDTEFMTSAVINGNEIRVSDTISTVQRYLGKPDERSGDQWTYKGKTDKDPSFVIMFSGDTVSSITKVKPNEN